MGLVQSVAESTGCREHGKDVSVGAGMVGPAHSASLPIRLLNPHPPACHLGDKDGEPVPLHFHSMLSLICMQR